MRLTPFSSPLKLTRPAPPPLARPLHTPSLPTRPRPAPPRSASPRATCLPCTLERGRRRGVCLAASQKQHFKVKKVTRREKRHEKLCAICQPCLTSRSTCHCKRFCAPRRDLRGSPRDDTPCEGDTRAPRHIHLVLNLPGEAASRARCSHCPSCVPVGLEAQHNR